MKFFDFYLEQRMVIFLFWLLAVVSKWFHLSLLLKIVQYFESLEAFSPDKVQILV